MPSLSFDSTPVTLREYGAAGALDDRVANLERSVAALRDESSVLRGRSKLFREESQQLPVHMLEQPQPSGRHSPSSAWRPENPKQQYDNIVIGQLPQGVCNDFSPTNGMHEDFGPDLVEFVKDVSERFHIRVFFLELVGQFLYLYVGILSACVLFFVYGTIGMRNRGFLRGSATFLFCVQNVAAMFTMISVYLWLFGCYEEVADAEVKAFLFFSLQRVATISIKYAFLTTEMYRELNAMIWTRQRVRGLLLTTMWNHPSPDVAERFMRTAFVSILGTKQMRSRLAPCFLPWPKTGQDAAWFRSRIDKTSKRLILVPAGDIESSMGFRKCKTAPFSQVASYKESVSAGQDSKFMGSVSAEVAEFLDRGSSRASALKGLTVVNGHEFPATGEDSSRSFASRQTISSQRLVTSSIATLAERGKPVAVEALFHFMVMSVLSSEAAMWPRVSSALIRVVPLLACNLGPLLCYLHKGGGQVSMSYAALVVAKFIPFSMFCGSSMKFLEIALKDFWRRRSLLRSCSAMLTLERNCRRGCPAEIDHLPILDLTDPRSIEAWRKIRQLSMDWGVYFFNRVQGFTSFFAGTCLVLAADLALSLEVKQYEKHYPVTVQKLIIYSSIFSSCGLSILFLVYLGQEINDLSSQHVLLLRRQRTILLSTEHMKAAEAADLGHELPLDAKALRSAEMIAALCEDLDDEARAKPVKLLGLYCGYSLLSFMYFVPAGLALSLMRFCSDPETSFKCTATRF